MPTILKEVSGIRLYARGPREESRYFISEKTDSHLRRLQIVEAVATPLTVFSDRIYAQTAKELLDTAQELGVEQYFEVKLETEK